ncbi:RsmB/NOP family class I SAM-dependent RNA methyltransferase [Sphingomonas sp. AR_OL41]|uniref:RsmB/NOP family class I SAM-dependent RNA methyltransferase n=1 Tax=Sphingomonas sp. AR_OL41 TaxID=3042729 RepID=UPI0024817834|nr:RsmB/NOP family class I SAM-dependent RNA methyltransferase [Sphingomonas sp. AR_OL41]MDH7972923.1 RsmB/NOP family class I SAM-dependent RNA methyltransferase [Sphingomonas sp. AR_OL41]
MADLRYGQALSALQRRRDQSRDDAPGLAARRAALKLLDAVLRQGLPLEAALNRATVGIDRPDDRALAHAIAAATLRRLPDLDALIDSATKQNLPDDAKARFALRIALAQVLVLATPPHAAITTALPLVDGGPRKLVHGVFGTLMRGEAKLPAVATLPTMVAERWRAAWGDAMVAAAAEAITNPPPLDLTLLDPAETEAMVAELDGVSLLPGHVRRDAGGVTELPGFEAGRWWVQDIAASLPARLLGRGTGTALDLCAAPGGKTMQLASAGWSVTAIDASQSRLARLSENLERTGLSAEVIAADLLTWKPKAPVDAVLLDAPCTATGIFRRHPDVIHRVLPSRIAEMAALQAKLLARAADWVKPGGLLVYATCSLEPAEGEAQVAALLAARSDYAIDPVRAEELPAGIVPDARGQVRTLPGMIVPDDCDGFFIARLRRQP